MSAAIKKTEETDNVNLKKWAFKILRKRLKKIENLRDAALHVKDIEGVHQMRVATRRMRSAIRSFSVFLNKKQFIKADNDLKKLANLLGIARDNDVAIASFLMLAEKAPDNKIKNGIQLLINERQALRQIQQNRLEKKLTSQFFVQLNKRFNKSLKKSALKKSHRFTTIDEIGREVVFVNLSEFCELSSAIYHPQGISELHKLRIAAKRLRYSIEFFIEFWGENLTPIVESITEMQDYLGEIHDTDIWIKDLGKRLHKSQKDLSSDDFHSSVWLLSEFNELRTRNYQSVIFLWTKWEENNFIENLRQTFSSDDKISAIN